MATESPATRPIAAASDDNEIMLRLMRQDQDALLLLYERFGSQVYSLTLRILRDSRLAEEATQDTFLKVWHKSVQWDAARGQVSSWLLTIARYTAIDRLRKEKRHAALDAEDLETIPDQALSGSPVGDRRWMDGQLLRQLLTRLPAEQAQVIELAFYQGMTHSELAEYLGWPLGTVKTRLRLGLEKLRAMWQETL